MNFLKKRFHFSIALFLFAFPLLAQEEDSTPQNEVKIIESKDIPLDTLALPLLEQKAIQTTAVNGDIKDNPLTLTAKENTPAKYDLKDNEHAAKYDSLWMKELLETNVLFEDMYAEIENLDLDATYETEINTDSLKARLERLNQKTPFNITYNPSLENVIKSFLKRKRGLMERMLTVSQFYFPLFEQQLDNYDIPLEMKYLAIVESALNPRARSRVGATGLWQFMYSTGKMYKLDVSSYVDERSDPIKATEAACKYLGRLYDIFDDWDLALAAYNSGPGNVNKAIRRSGGKKNYWNIRRNLPRETAGYVPAFIATMYLFEYADEYGLKAKEVDRNYFITDTIHVKSLITFKQISELVGVDVEELKLLNPSYKLNVIPYVDGKNYSLRLPVAAMGKFVANEDAIYAHVEKELKSKESPMPQLVKAQDQIRYKVRSGDYLGKIASRYGVGVSQIKRWNGLRSNNLRIGQRLTIFTRNPSITSSKKTVAKTTKKVVIPPGAKVHTVQSGDSLWTISKKYPGISIENLREWNGISGKNLKPGTKLKLCACPS
ncbi:membrane-bound lytic murein transglycosylase D [Maribacter vaceletii]|uniref:Membrane-bound lytic murein transglycosylase D n=1 Tax=Maribacter vaceletii TaxID=1206816 RepID=A0A495EE17_9FLAO|nr:LysM peptidoglycan-binding domain-containing protein [Maribacter vaceletii]RKR14793.1 membrane-bound lytic murein transglycosylase D [Maribacter vaceletii]